MLTQQRLKEILNYSPDTGIFTRLIARAGYVVGSLFLYWDVSKIYKQEVEK